MKPTPNTDRYGRPGSPIAGSKYVRGYCTRCAAPMRVTDHTLPAQCDDCKGQPSMTPTATPRRTVGQGVGCWKGT